MGKYVTPVDLSTEQRGYLGYLIVRARRGIATVGRTMILPSPVHENLSRPEEFASRVRTMVKEELNLYGVNLEARGVPFMQQDGAVSSCSHVTAWMAHYTAVLRCIVSRVPIGRMAAALSDSQNQYGRQYPTQGLADGQTLRLLSEAGLAPAISFVEDLTRARAAEWYDRPALHASRAPVRWHHENFTSEIARYLNSGLPVLLSIRNHSVLICGYLRQSEFVDAVGSKPTLELPDPGRVAALIVHDESEGPYRVRRVSDILSGDHSDATLIVPLPPGLALSGSDAETLGAEAFKAQCSYLVGSPERFADRTGGDIAYQAVKDVSKRLDDRHLAVRTYASWGTDLKASLQPRGADPDLIRAFSYARLPRFVWVVEIIDRGLRGARQPPVIGEVVIDATASVAEAPEVIIRVPGHIEIRDPVTGMSSGWICPLSCHNSGRWAQSAGNPWWYGSPGQKWKVAGAP